MVVAAQIKTKDELAVAAPARPGLLRWMFVAAPLVFLLYNVALLYMVRTQPGFLFHFIRVNYNFNTQAMPAYLAFCGAVGFFRAWRRRTDLLAPKLKRWSAISIVTAMLLASARLWATEIEPSLLQVRRVTIPTPKLTAPLRILHITDIQSPGVGGYEERAFAIMRGLNADLVIFSGDLLQPLDPATFKSEVPKIDKLLRTLTPRLGVIAVGGDVDPPIRLDLKKGLGGMRLLEDKSIQLDTGEGRLNIYGINALESHGDGDFHPEINEWFAKAPAADFTILIGHAPDYVLGVSKLPIDLCLAGHTHGGQIRLPLFGPPITFSNIPRNLARGLHTIDRTRLNVSAGLGGEHMEGIPNIRVNCPPEMTLIELVPAK